MKTTAAKLIHWAGVSAMVAGLAWLAFSCLACGWCSCQALRSSKL